MGLVRNGFPDHEGYAVGFVMREGTDNSLRELACPADNEEKQVLAIAAACDCGWRSPRWKPARSTRWSPYSIFASEADEERVHMLWSKHLDEAKVGKGANATSGGAEAKGPRPESPKETPACRFCGEPLWAGLGPTRTDIESHLAKHAPLHPCLGSRDGCKYQTNAYESSSSGYCLSCDADPAWKPVAQEAFAVLGDGVSGHLSLNGDGGGLRHFLNGKPVHAGERLELLLGDGRWIAGHYEWSFVGDDPPNFRFDLGDGATGSPDRELPEGILKLPDEAVLRWPSEGKGR